MILAFVSLFFYSENSPLYETNSWSGPNYFITVGRGIVHGLVPYKDLFEQKGPFLYFLHALAVQLTGNNFYGVYILESIAMLFNLLLLYHIGRFFLSSQTSFVVTLFLPALLLASTGLLAHIAWFETGDSAEEFAVPMILYLIYSIIKYSQTHELLFPMKNLFVLGALMGLLFWTKYTLIGAFIGFYLFLGGYLLLKKEGKRLLQAILSSFLGFGSVSAFILLYFAANHAIGDLFKVYFWINLTTYSTKTSVWGHLHAIFQQLFNGFSAFPLLIVLLLAEFYFLFKRFKKRENGLQTALVICSFLFAVVFALIDGRPWIYYFLIVVPFFSLGLIALGDFFANSFKKARGFSTESLTSSVGTRLVKKWQLVPLMLGALLFPFLFNTNIFQSQWFVKRGQSAQVHFAKIIHQVKYPTLLNYGIQDVGFYLAANVLPASPYFAQNYINYQNFPVLNDTQSAVIAKGEVDFVITDLQALAKNNSLINPKSKVPLYLKKNYQLVASQTTKGTKITYLLYERKKLLKS